MAFFEALTPICIFAIIFGTVVAFRYMKHRETVKLIEQGFPPESVRGYAQGRYPLDVPATPSVGITRSEPGRAQLLWGLVLTGIGLALTLALWPIGFAVNRNGTTFPLGIGPWMIGGFIPLFVGLALVLAYIIARPDASVPAAPAEPPPITPWDVDVPPPAPALHEGRQSPEGP